MARLREVIPDVDRVLEGKGPQCLVELVRPVEQLMHHEAQPPAGDGLNGSFTNSVLKVSSSSTKRDRLILELEILQDLFRTKWVIICME